jgi:hypothetical protein
VSNTTLRLAPSPTASLNSVKLDKHQPQPIATVGTADPSPPGFDPAQPPLDLTTILLLALFFAIVATAFWKVLLKVVIVVGVALVLAAILVPVVWMTSPH